MSEAAAIPADLLDLGRLAEWMDAEGLESGPIVDVRRLTGGTQNIIARFRRGGRIFVLRRPPKRSIAGGSKTMRREARVLAALAGTDVPHPALIAACDSDNVLGAAFYLMEPIDGFNPNDALPDRFAGDPAALHAMGLSIVDGALALSRVDIVAAGLEGLGKTDNYLERQASRWKSQYEGYSTFQGWNPDSLTGIADVGAWLVRNCPRTFVPGLIHGDYHMANVMFRHDRPELAAIIDWELTSLGDPLIDLGWLLATWYDAEDDTAIVDVTARKGFPEPAELIEYYAARSHRNMDDILWFKVLACYKLGIILEGTNARAMAGHADRAVGNMLHGQAQYLLRKARRSINKGSAR